MCILPSQPPRVCPAHLLDCSARRHLALDALSGCPIDQLASDHLVSRKFVYQQLHKAHAALDLAFEQPADDPEDLLFWLPVTKPWLRQLVLALALSCHSPYRGIIDLFADLFDLGISIGTVHNVLRRAASAAESINSQQDLSAVRFAALDEIFQAGSPVLVAADTRSGYCCLLSPEEHRDADTWGVRLLELRERGFQPQATVADFGSGLRCGARQALPDTPCRADVFHPLRDFQALARGLDNRAYEALSYHEDLQRRQARYTSRHVWKSASLAKKAVLACAATDKAIALADEVRTLLEWWRQDVVAVAGPDHATRCQLHDWIVEELRAREPLHQPIRKVRQLLENHKDGLLAFALQLDEDLGQLAERFEVSSAVVREALAVGQMDERRPSRWQREQQLWQQLGGKYAQMRVEVEKLAAAVVRASSVIENLNSRLRNYFFLRKQLGGGYLGLLQFYLNHHRYARSERAERQGKSPREVLNGQEHEHWLELLGYERFRQAAA
jgi:hypothetical protein